MDVLLFPYLPLDARRTIGGWELVPREALEEADVSSPEMVRHARDVAASAAARYSRSIIGWRATK